MNPDSHGADSMAPATIIEIGRVAKQWIGASMFPAKPPTTKTMVT